MGKTQQAGLAAENAACDYLQKQGLHLVTRNYRCRMGEIDLIMRDDTDLIFVEVRYRKNDSHGGGLQSVNSSKQTKLIRAASFYLQQKRLMDNTACRFDVVAINASASIEWIKNAFQLM